MSTTTEWAVRVGFDTGSPNPDQMIELEEEFGHLGFDAAVSAVPELGQWAVTIHLNAEMPQAAISEVLICVEKLVGVAPLAVEAMRFDEYERRAQAPTLPVLFGASEVADLLKVSRQRVHQLRSLAGFPAPLVEVAMGPLWDARAVEKFAREWTRRPGRPAKAS